MSNEVFEEMSDTLFALFNTDKMFAIRVCMDLAKTVQTYWDTPYSYVGELLGLIEDWLENPSIELEDQINDKELEVYSIMDYEDNLNGNTTAWYAMNMATVISNLVALPYPDRQVEIEDFIALIDSICIVASFEPDGRDTHLEHMNNVLNSLRAPSTKVDHKLIEESEEKYQVMWDLVCQNIPQTGVYALVNAQKYADEIGMDFSEKIQRAILERRGEIDLLPYVNPMRD